MNIFVTVGTTKFDSLIETVDLISFLNEHEVTYQISNGNYHPKNGIFFKFTEDLNQIIDSSDLIITHAGAGSIYSLLESGKKLIVAPNLERVDKHQLEIAQYCFEKNYCSVAFELSDLSNLIELSQSKVFAKYVKDEFFLTSHIAALCD